MTHAPPHPADPGPTDLGRIFQTRYEDVDLGMHGDSWLRARVRRRTLRLAIGHRRHVTLEIGRVRPVAIEVTTAATTYDVPVPAPIDPSLRLTMRLALLWLASALAIRLLHARQQAAKGANR